MTQWSFAKYVGCGNDFILFDNRSETFPAFPLFIQRLCHRQKGIGADGVLLLENSIRADFRLRIFNSDGSEAEMCGNGLRCLIKWLIHLGFQYPLYRIEVMREILTARVVDRAICIHMGSPRNIQWDIPLRFENQFLRVHSLNTGVPHAVVFVDDVESVNLLKLGAYLRNYSLWMPMGINVTITQKMDEQRIKIRTYERGVEGETLACGTGATAAALAIARQKGCVSPVRVETRSGEELQVTFSFENHKFYNVTLTGNAEYVFQGEIHLPDPEAKCLSIGRRERDLLVSIAKRF